MTNDKDGAALLREAIHNALSSELGDAYDCGRVWEAWHVGTMGEDDFAPVNDRVDEITETVLAALQSHGQAFDAAGVREACAKVAESWVKCDYSEECNILADSIADEIRALPIPEADAIGSHFGNGGGLDPVRACGCPECEASPGFGGGNLREGPAPIPNTRMQCFGCKHLETEDWREPSGDGETFDRGTSADCKAIPGGKSIGVYWSRTNDAPKWCPFLPSLSHDQHGGAGE